MGSDWLETVSDWPSGAVDLYRMTAGKPPSRNALVSRMLQGLTELLADFRSAGFKHHHAEFVSANYLQGRTVAVADGKLSFSGKVVTVDPDGARVLKTETGARRIISGDVRVRPACPPVEHYWSTLATHGSSGPG